MRTTPYIILALDPSSRECGVAMLVAGELQYFKIKTLPRRLSGDARLAKARQLATDLLDSFQPDVVVVSRKRQRSPLVIVMVRQIEQIAEQRTLDVKYYGIAETRLAICLSDRATKRDITGQLIALFPVLRHYCDRPTKWQIRYRQRLFDAIAVGFTHFQIGRESARISRNS